MIQPSRNTGASATATRVTNNFDRDYASRSDSSSSPPLTFSSSAGQSASSTQSPPTPRTPSRYPSTLSVNTSQLRPSKGNISPTSGKPYQYQSLEDLLKAKGYRETRIFTPETELTVASQKDDSGIKESMSGATSSDDKDADSGGGAMYNGVGAKVASLLSGLMPAALAPNIRAKEVVDHRTSVDIQTEQQPKITIEAPSPYRNATSPFSYARPESIASTDVGSFSRGRGSRVPRTALTNALESALRKAQEDDEMYAAVAASTASILPFRRRTQDSIPSSSQSTLTTSSSSSTIRPPSRQLRLMQQQKQLRAHGPLADETNRLVDPTDGRPNLRHVASAPTVGRTRAKSAALANRRLPTPQPRNNQGPAEESWVSSLTNLLAHASAIPSGSTLAVPASRTTTVPAKRSRSATAPGRRSGSQRTRHFTPAPTVATTTVRADTVICRSAPGSRSSSQVRPPQRQNSLKSIKSVKSLKLPSSNKGIDSPLLSPSIDLNREMAGLFEHDRKQADAADGDDEDSDDDPPTLESIIALTVSRPRRAATGSELDSDSDDQIARRQRSIQSLRAHLANPNASSKNVATPGVNGVPPLPPLPLPLRAKTLEVLSATTTSSPAGSDHEAWVDGWDSKRPAKQRKGILPQWLASHGGEASTSS